MATTISLRETLSSEPTITLRQQMNNHDVDGVLALKASIVAKNLYRRHFGQYGRLGDTIGSIIPANGDGYRLNTQLGHIDVSPLDFKPVPYVTYNITVQFVGLKIDETNETYDEPYIVSSVISLAPDFAVGDQLVSTQKIAVVGEDHPAGHVYADTITISKEGQLIGGTGIKITVFAFEEDSGDPDEVAEAINEYLKEKAEQSAQAIGQAYSAGAAATAIADSPEFQWFLTVVSLGLAGWVADDEVGYASSEIPISEIKDLAKLTDAQFSASLKTGPNGIKYNKEIVVEGDGKYTTYFRVSAAEIPPITIPTPADP